MQNANGDLWRITIDTVNKLVEAHSDILKQCSKQIGSLQSENGQIKNRLEQNQIPTLMLNEEVELPEMIQLEKNIIIPGLHENVPNGDSKATEKLVHSMNPSLKSP